MKADNKTLCEQKLLNLEVDVAEENVRKIVKLEKRMDVDSGRQMTMYLPTATTTVSHVFDLAQAFCTNGP